MLEPNLWIHRQFVGLGVAAGFFLMGCSGTDGTSGPNLIAVTACTETFTPCGGDPTGNWVFVSGCVDNDLTNAANQEMGAQYPACAGIFTSVTASVAGSINIASGSYDQEEDFSAVSHVSVTPTCFSAIASGTLLSVTTCSQYQAGLNQQAGTTAACNYDGTNCNCGYTMTRHNSELGTYTISGTTVTTTTVDAGTSQVTTEDFCVQGSSLVLRDTSGTGAVSISHLSKR